MKQPGARLVATLAVAVALAAALAAAAAALASAATLAVSFRPLRRFPEKLIAGFGSFQPRIQEQSVSLQKSGKTFLPEIMNPMLVVNWLVGALKTYRKRERHRLTRRFPPLPLPDIQKLSGAFCLL